MDESLYDVLEVAEDASDEEILDAYRKAAMKHHPDRAGGDHAAFQRIAEAFKVLGDREKRTRYDDLGATEDPKSPEAKQRAMAVQLLVSMVMDVVEMDDGLFDMKAQIQKRLLEIVIERQAEIKGHQRKIKKLEKGVTRWRKVSGGRNPIANAVARKIAGLREAIKSSENSIELSQAMQVMLREEWEYLWDRPPTVDERDRGITYSPQVLIRLMGGGK